MEKIYNIYLDIKRWLSTTIHKDIGKGISSLKNFWYENEARNHWIETKRKTLKNWDNLLKKLEVLIPKESRYLIIVLFWLVLLLEGNISQQRLIIFIVILIVIYIYKWLYVNIIKMYKYIRVNQNILLKIYKYKNPLMWLLIELEIKIFYFLYNLEKRGVKPLYVKWIYKILYNFTGINGIKIILYKFYNILYNWIQYKVYELVFQRMLGMILSVLIFTDIIKKVLEILNSIYPSNIVWIYILLIIIPYIFTLYSLIDIESSRLEINLIWNVLKIMNINQEWYNLSIINPSIINKDIKIFIGIYSLKTILNYDNYIIYLIFKIDIPKWIQYNKPLYFYLDGILYYFSTDYIYTKNSKVKKLEKNKDDLDVLNYCKYQILLYKLIIFYIWDIEKELGVINTLLQIQKENYDLIPVLPVEIPDNATLVLYEYNINELKFFFNKKIENLQSDKFWNIIENYNFYKEMHNYLNDYNFQITLEYKRLENLKKKHCVYNIYTENGSNYEQQKLELEYELNNMHMEWLQQSNVSSFKELKYLKIFYEIQTIKDQYYIK